MRTVARLCALALLLSSAALANPAKTVSGRVTDAKGKPLPGISVWALQEPYRFIEEGQRPDVLTGPDGRFSLPLAKLPAGSHLAVCGAGFETATVALQPGPLKVALRPGPGARIAGRVVDPRGKPVAGFRLMAVMSGTKTGCALKDSSACPEPDTYAMSKSDAQGRFVLEALAPGWYRVDGWERGYRPYLSDPVRIAPGQSFDTMTVTLQEGAVVTGRVLSSDGTPVAGAQVANSRGWFAAETVSDAQGRYRLSGLAAGGTDVFVDHPTLGAAQSRLDLQDGENRLDVRLVPDGEIRGRVLAPDGSPDTGARVWVDEKGEKKTKTGADGTFVLPAHAGPVTVQVESDRGVRTQVSGVVSAGQPLTLEVRLVEGAAITGRITGLAKPQKAQLQAARDDQSGATFTEPDAQGVYHFQHLEPGVWIVTISDSGEREVSGDGDVIFNGRKRQSAPVLAEEGREARVDFDFPSVIVVRGRVLGPEEKPRESRWVSWHRTDDADDADDAEGSSYVGKDGTFAFVLEPGSYEIASTREGFAPVPLHLDVQAPQTEPIELHLGPETVLTGRILGLAPGHIVESVQAQGPNGFPHALGRADQEGGYRVGGLTPGTWTIKAEIENREITQQVVIPPGAASVVQDLDFSRHETHPGESAARPSRPSSPCG